MTVRIEDIRLPEIRRDASESDKRLLQALYDQFRDTNARLAALEGTLGNVPRKIGTLPYATSPLTTKGDVWGYSTLNARVPIGTNGYVLTADSTQGLGLKWATAPAGAVMAVSAWSDTAQNVASGDWDPITFNRELYDSNTVHSISSNTQKFTVPTGGAGKWSAFWRGGVTYTSGTDTLTMVMRINDNFDVSTYDFPLTINVTQRVEMIFPPTLLADGDYLTIIPQNGEDLTVGDTNAGPNAGDPYIPASINSAMLVFWREGT